MNKTVLNQRHIELGARMAAFGGWDMPIQYKGILQEHTHTRKMASIFDICHMGEFELSGGSALEDLERLLSCNVRGLELGQVRYGFMLNDDGGTIDDLTCYRLSEERFMLVVNAATAAGDVQWIQSRISKNTRFVDLSPATAKLDIQGPRSREVLEDVFGCNLPDLGYFRFKEFETGVASCILSRTGYTGEWGYEIYLPVEAAGQLWDTIVAHKDCEPAGLGARDTLRLEMGYPLYGHELTDSRTPAVTSQGAFIDFQQGFIGKSNVRADLTGPAERLVGLRFESRRAAREGDTVYAGGAAVGAVTSGSVAPSLGTAVAMAFVKIDLAETGRTLDVEIRGKLYPAEVVDLPFYKDGTARKKMI